MGRMKPVGPANGAARLTKPKVAAPTTPGRQGWEAQLWPPRLQTIALVAVLEPLPGLVANTDATAWSLGVAKTRVQPVLDELKQRNLTYRRSHHGDCSLWSSSSVDLARWQDVAGTKVRAPERLEDVASPTSSRPAVAHLTFPP